MTHTDAVHLIRALNHVGADLVGIVIALTIIIFVLSARD